MRLRITSRTTRRLLRACLWCGLCLALCEIASRLLLHCVPAVYRVFPGPEHDAIEALPAGEQLYRGHHYCGLEMNPVYTGPLMRINSLGLRGLEPAGQKEAGELRIACLGGSTTMSLYSWSDTATYPAQLEQLLREALPGRRITVYNAGVGTYTSAEVLTTYLFKISPLNPDLVIFYESINDVLAQAYFPANHADYRQYRKVWRDVMPTWLRTAHRWFGWSQFVRLLHVRLYPETLDVWAYSLHANCLDDTAALRIVRQPDFGQHYRRNVRHLAALARVDGATLVPVTFILNDNVAQAWREGVARQNEVLRALAAELRLPLYDLAEVYAACEPPPPVFYENAGGRDLCHFSDAGNLWLAQHLANFLTPLLAALPPSR